MIVADDKRCRDIVADRSIGAVWERAFSIIAAKYANKAFTLHQLKTTGAAVALSWNAERKAYDKHVLPDVTLWSSDNQHHEIKHKAPTRNGTYGLEEYRFEHLLWFANKTQQTVYYTIHDHKKAGGRDATANRIEHWVTASVVNLDGQHSARCPGKTWCNGQPAEVWILYWSTELFVPLASIWSTP